MITLKQLPNSEKPYEKLEMYGEKALSDSELLAIILKTGTKNQTAVSLAQNILTISKEKSLRGLQEIPIKELMQIKGVGKVKAIQIRAICELAKRMSKPFNLNVTLKEPKDVYNLLIEELRYEKREIVKILILNNKNVLQKIVDISIGDISSAVIDLRQIFEEIIKTGMIRFILVHNHPSGDVTPSMQDIETTKRISEGAKILQLQLLDHVIIGDGKFQSILNYRKL